VQKITDNIFQISGAWGSREILGGNVFILADKQLTLVDAGYSGTDCILESIRQLGYSPVDIHSIILTHHHPDHIRGLAYLKNNSRAQVLAHADEAPYVTGQISQPGPCSPIWLKYLASPFRRLWATRAIHVDTVLHDGDELPILGGVRIVHTPGHTPGSIILYFYRLKAVIIGDLLTHGDKLYLPSREFTVDKAAERESIRKVSGLDFEIACFGHGPPLLHDANLYLREFAADLDK
jgi:glyoxylase-like metal-dependent hydrolase (beta-lactamase superfamily II)